MATGRSDAVRELCGLVSELAQRISDHVGTCASTLELTEAQAVALRELTGPMTSRELARRMSCEPSNVTYVVDRLARLGLVERQPDPHDRRAKQLVLTECGAKVRDDLLATLVVDSPLEGLSAAEQRQLHDLLLRAIKESPNPKTRTRPRG
ncbi:MarR family transcriptional regulator [Kribbella capetownensis]|uniref:MarR family transcriptional regulator n=1 Tax=Kribbella capetownensis TaxID=1572659 RepID=A0A4V2M8E6_9ACTN|nr:MarR family transcriptional regulator [Kribbella capetownensis]TCC51182.1 MarR family transcriptional regulator [Kribbella capetownensis]